MSNNKIRVPIVVKQLKPKKLTAYIPDFDVTVHGEDYVEIVANASVVASAIYVFYRERNLDCHLRTSLTDADNLAMKDKKSFATTIALLT